MTSLQRSAPLLLLLAACGSEPTTMDDSISPAPARTGATGATEAPTVLDEVEVMGADEAAAEAEAAIDESNVLDALEELEQEIGKDD